MIDSLAAVAEFIARSEPNFEFDRWLASRGVDVAHAWNVAGPICVHQVTPWRRGIFNFAASEVEYEAFTEAESVGRADHVRAVVHIARDVDDETPVDLIAWPPLQPARIFRYLGKAVVLGFSQLYDPASYFAGGVLPVHRTPLDWLAAGCRGIVVLDFKEFRDPIHRMLPYRGSNRPRTCGGKSARGDRGADRHVYVEMGGAWDRRR
jgi:hypothetical protein